MNLFPKLRSLLVILFLLASSMLSSALTPPPAARAQSGPPVYDTDLVIKPYDTRVCFDSEAPYTLVVSEGFTGTTTLNWHTGSRTFLSKAHIAACGPNGTVYVGTPGAPGTRIRPFYPEDHPIEHTPQYVAADGSH